MHLLFTGLFVVAAAAVGGLLGEGARDEIPISTSQHVGVARSDTQVLRCILLLCLGHVCAAVLAIVHALAGPGRLRREGVDNLTENENR